MKIGFAKVDITPPVGVELAGFGPYILRRSIAVRDRLWARAMAVEAEGGRLILVSCDLIDIRHDQTRLVRELTKEQTGVPCESVMVHCIHTHSGPSAGGYNRAWGEVFEPFVETLPHRIVKACREAVENLRDSQLFHAETPCSGIGLNREYEETGPTLEEALLDDWKPAKPELTDTTCHVFRVESEGRTTGFISSYGCHPVVCCADSRFIHGDYAGVATNMIEREYPGSVGLFLLGAHGDVNSCVVHKPEKESLLALDIIAARYANAVRRGLRDAAPVEVSSVASALRTRAFSRKQLSVEDLRKRLNEHEATIASEGLIDLTPKVRKSTLMARALRKIIASLERGELPAPHSELQGFRIGSTLFLASPFEVFQAIKNDVKAGADAPLTIVMSCTNDTQGYATDRCCAERGGYAADFVPILQGWLPFAAIHDELTSELLALAEQLKAQG